MNGTRISARARLLGLVLATLLASGCYAVPPPLMYGPDPVAAGHLRLEGALAGEVAPFNSLPHHADRALPFPGVVLGGRLGLGHGASVGLRLFGTGATLDGRLEVLHTPRLSLSVGLSLGASAGLWACYPPPRTTDCGATPLLTSPPILVLGSLPVVLAWRIGGRTVFLGLRPGARVVGAGLRDPGNDPSAMGGIGVPGTTRGVAVYGTEPLAGALLGYEVPVSRRVSFQLELDVTRSFVNPGTVTTLALGIRD